MTCSDPAHRMLQHAPIPCDNCRGWLDHDGTVMSTPTMLERYPWMRELVDHVPADSLPDYQPTPAHQALVLTGLLGRLARAGLMIIILALLLAFLIALIRGH